MTGARPAAQGSAPTRQICCWAATRLALCLTALLALGAGVEQQEWLLEWDHGPGTLSIGDGIAELDLDESFVFLDAERTEQLLERLQNPISGNELATVALAAEGENWFLVFEWDEVGYVPDDERDALDPEVILEALRRGNEASNETREERGWPALEIVGWSEPPHYDAASQNLAWAIVGESEGARSVNRQVKLLGRRGVMTATLVAKPGEMDRAAAIVDTLLAGYRFTRGHTYAEYVPGTDKLAEHGLTALVVGGGGEAAPVEPALSARFRALIAVGLVVVGAVVLHLLGRGRAKAGPSLPA